MASTPTDLKYAKDHGWVRVRGGEATIGITDFAQRQLGEIMMVEITVTSGAIEAGSAVGTLESVKAVTEAYAPVSGTVLATNSDRLNDDSDLVNSDPYGDGWLIRIKMSDTSELDDLMSAAQYDEFVKDGD